MLSVVSLVTENEIPIGHGRAWYESKLWAFSYQRKKPVLAAVNSRTSIALTVWFC